MCRKYFIVTILFALVAAIVMSVVVCVMPFEPTTTSYTAYAETVTEQPEPLPEEEQEQPPAEEGEEVTEETPEEQPSPEPAEPTEQASLAESIIGYLKAVYGDDYQKYYDEIVARWGSIEEYILNAADSLPEEYKYNVNAFLTSIKPIVGIAADCILLFGAAVWIFIMWRKNKKKKAADKAMNDKINADLEALKAAQNQTATANIAIIQAQKAQNKAFKSLMPGTKFEAATAQLCECDKALTAAEEEVKRDV